MSRTQMLKERAHNHASTARQIAEQADAQKRALTADEQTRYDHHMNEGRKLLDQIKSSSEDDEVKEYARELVREIGGVGGKSSSQTGAKSWAQSTLKSLRGEATATRGGVKALVSGTIGVADPVTAGTVAMPTAPRTILDLVRGEAVGKSGDALYDQETSQQLVQSLFGGGGEGGNTYTFLRQVTRENNAAPVADQAQKPTSIYTIQEVEGRYRVIAHLSEPVPQRFFHDDKTLADFLAKEMANGLEEEVEAQILTGDGVGENLTGILNTSGIHAQPFTTDLLTTTRKALTQLQSKGVTPTAWALNPADAEAFDLLREGTGDGAFLLGGPGSAAGTSLWTLPRVPSVAVPVGTAVLADWEGAELKTRQGATLHVDVSGEHFDKNTVRFRVEGRYGLAVVQPAAFVEVSLTSAAG